MSLTNTTAETQELSQRRHISAPSLPNACSWDIIGDVLYVSNTLMTEKQGRASESGTTFSNMGCMRQMG